MVTTKQLSWYACALAVERHTSFSLRNISISVIMAKWMHHKFVHILLFYCLNVKLIYCCCDTNIKNTILCVLGNPITKPTSYVKISIQKSCSSFLLLLRAIDLKIEKTTTVPVLPFLYRKSRYMNHYNTVACFGSIDKLNFNVYCVSFGVFKYHTIF